MASFHLCLYFALPRYYLLCKIGEISNGGTDTVSTQRDKSPDLSHLLCFFVCWINSHGEESWYFARVFSNKMGFNEMLENFWKATLLYLKSPMLSQWTLNHFIYLSIYQIFWNWTAWLICLLGHRKLNRDVSGPRTDLWGYQEILM